MFNAVQKNTTFGALFKRNLKFRLERMLKFSLIKKAKVKICGSCADARGIKNNQLIEGVEISTMAEFTNWVVDSDKVLTF